MAQRENTALRREQIIEATRHLLATTPIAGITTRQLAAELGLSQPALFRHFTSREALILAVIDDTRQGLERMVAPIIGGPGPAAPQLLALGQTLLAEVERAPGLPHLLFASATSAPVAVRTALQQIVAMQVALVAELVREGQRQGDLAPEADADAAATLFVGMLQGLVLRWEIAGRPEPPGVRFPVLFAHWLRGVAAAPTRTSSSPAAASASATAETATSASSVAASSSPAAASASATAETATSASSVAASSSPAAASASATAETATSASSVAASSSPAAASASATAETATSASSVAASSAAAAQPTGAGRAPMPSDPAPDPDPGRPPLAGGTALARLDVRPILAGGADPLTAILAALGPLPQGGVLVVEAPFRPGPLLTLLARRGHAATAEALAADHWLVEVVTGGQPAIEDLRDREPPEPLERVLLAGAALHPGQVYLARLPRFPRLLLPRLRERGLLFAVLERPDGTALLRVQRPA